jgi:hypothetical protein
MQCLVYERLERMGRKVRLRTHLQLHPNTLGNIFRICQPTYHAFELVESGPQSGIYDNRKAERDPRRKAN